MFEIFFFENNPLYGILRITTKPVVVRSEDEDLKIKWAQACRQGELLLIEILLNHLEKVIAETRSILRDISGQTYKELKKANATEAKQNMKEALKRPMQKENSEPRIGKRES